MIITILLFIVILGLLVFVHEAGHFLVAKRSGMKVDEFGFGFPPRIFGFQKVDGRWRLVRGHKAPENPDSTVYSVNWIPLGGFVKIVGENNEAESDPRSFINKPFFPRLLTLLAGVLMNVALAAVIFSIGYIVGLQVAVDNPASLGPQARFTEAKVVILDVVPDSPAAQSGLRSNDIVQNINGQSFDSVSQLQQYIRDHRTEQLRFTVQRVNENKEFTVTPQADPPPGRGHTGIALATVGKLSFPVHIAVVEGVKTTFLQIGAIIKGIYGIFSTGQGLESLGGPVKIAQLTGQVAKLGVMQLLQFTAFLSLNLAILNALPFPALDGGRVLFLIIEKIRGKRNNQKIEQFANAAGFLLLLLLMAVITFRDITRLGS
jgi:regulator of sigma E protease